MDATNQVGVLIVVFASLVAVALPTARYESSVVTAGNCAVGVVLVLAAWSDVATGRIPNALAGCGAAAVVIVSAVVVVRGEVALGAVLVRLGVALLASGAVALLVVWMVRPQLVGGGDVKLLSVAAAMVGLASPVATAVVGATAAVAHAVAAAVARRRSLPFAPALFVGFLAGIGFVSWEAGR